MRTRRYRYVVFLGVLGLLAGKPAGVCAQHPSIKLAEDGKTPDFASCQGCHAAKSTGASVHAAVQAGCNACHTVEKYGKETDVTLAAEDNDLCFTCHQDKQPQPAQLTVHPPARKGLCNACHEPHSGPNAGLLRKPTDGLDPATNLCLGCHATIAAQIQKPVKHVAVDGGCGICHATHKSEPADKPEGMFHLTQAQPDLCLACHDASDAALQKAHKNQPFAGSRCTECHNPHGSDRPKLINNFVHAAFEGDSCDTCHTEPKEGKVSLAEGARREMCLTCHADIQEKLSQTKVKHVALEMDEGCVACHSPHASAYPHQLRQGPVRTCLTCHTDLAEARAGKQFLHRPAFERGCAICHQPHGGERERFLRAETNDLCLECHNVRILGALRLSERQKTPLKLFSDSVSVEPNALEGIKTLQLDAKNERGHPFLPRHPVRGSFPIASNITCLTCHQPHAANGSKRLYVKDSADQGELCRTCH